MRLSIPPIGSCPPPDTATPVLGTPLYMTTGADVQGVPLHTADSQTSLVVITSISSQGVPSLFGAGVHVPLAGSQTPSLWQSFNAGQLTPAHRFTPAQAPFVHESVVVLESPSSQGEPLDFGFEMQDPEAGSQTPSLWQSFDARQLTPAHRFTPAQAPFVHESEVVLESPSSQGEPLDFGFKMQDPEAGSQAPSLWQLVCAGQLTPAHRFTPAQAPFVHESVVVLESPSSQGEPLDFGFKMQDPEAGSQTPSLWQLVCAGQLTPAHRFTPAQAPFVHESVVVLESPSSQGEPLDFGFKMQDPEAGSQAPSLWQLVCAGQLTPAHRFTPAQAPFVHESEVVLESPSLQGEPLGFGFDMQDPEGGSQAPSLM